MGMGDELMALGMAKELHKTTGKKVCIVDAAGRPRKHELFENIPFVHQGITPQVSILKAHSGSGRPYFSELGPDGFKFKQFKPTPGVFAFSPNDIAFAEKLPRPTVILEPNIKNAISVDNKDWGFERWEELAAMCKNAGIPVHQIGQNPHPARMLTHATYLHTPTFKIAAAVLARTKAAVLPEGGLHHAAAALGIRAVVIYGGFISPAQTGYDLHINLFTGGEPCGSRKSCQHCRDSMAKITPAEVFEHLKTLL
jgi:ADP-heptose:LPS heptosyltransferase